VNVSSGLAWVPYPAAPVYSGAKAFVHAWTVSLREQLKDTSVRVVELLPPVSGCEEVRTFDYELGSSKLGSSGVVIEPSRNQPSFWRFIDRIAIAFPLESSSGMAVYSDTQHL
jgi:NADP-dependent 3-hydroxy acid dehydrogenase YdfG